MHKKEALEFIFDLENIDEPVLLEIISQNNYNIAKELGKSAAYISNLLSRLFPERPKNSGKVCHYLLKKYGYKYCPQCNIVKELSDFSKNKARSDGLASNCKSCMSIRQADYYPTYYAENKDKYAAAKIRYKTAINQATPSWADKQKIKQIYLNRPEGMQVDHIIPIQGINVCGLHVHNNLQYLTPAENISKSNKFRDT